MPCTFTVELKERHPIIFPGPPGEPGVQDLSRLIYYARVGCEGKAMAIESPSFTSEERESEDAMDILYNLLTYALADAVLSAHQKPQYKTENGVISRILSQPNNKHEP
jgi:hypothetical protein